MYYVHEHRFGAEAIKSGPMSGCLGLEEHKHTCVHKCRKKQEAIDTANASDTRAVVQDGCPGHTIYDNGKPPAPVDPRYPPKCPPLNED